MTSDAAWDTVQERAKRILIAGLCAVTEVRKRGGGLDAMADAKISILATELARLEAEIACRDIQVLERDALIAAKDAQILELSEEINRRGGVIMARDAEIAQKDKKISATVEGVLYMLSRACEEDAADGPGEDWADRIYARIRVKFCKEVPDAR